MGQPWPRNQPQCFLERPHFEGNGTHSVMRSFPRIPESLKSPPSHWQSWYVLGFRSVATAAAKRNTMAAISGKSSCVKAQVHVQRKRSEYFTMSPFSLYIRPYKDILAQPWLYEAGPELLWHNYTRIAAIKGNENTTTRQSCLLCTQMVRLLAALSLQFPPLSRHIS